MRKNEKPAVRRRRHFIILALAVIAGSAIGRQAVGAASARPADPARNELVVGALLSIRGPWSTLGQSSRAVLEIAVEEINDYLARQGSPTRVRLIVEDTQTDPTVALAKLKSLAERNVRFVIGPQASAEVSAIKHYAQEQGIIVISQSSTAHSLAIAGDNIFRFCPDDVRETEAMAALIREEGVSLLVPIWRDDAGNAGLRDSMVANFPVVGGKVLDGVRYGADTKDFAPVVRSLSSKVKQAVDDHSTKKVGVYLAAFDEAVHILTLAAADPLLASVRWYGSDGLVQSKALISDTSAASFAAKVGLPNPIFGLDESAARAWKPLVEAVTAKTGTHPDAFALATYDALWVVARTFEKMGPGADTESLKAALAGIAEAHSGATGNTRLNAAGDRAFGNFDFWAICRENGSFAWERVAVYQTEAGGPGTVKRLAGCGPRASSGR
jgi:branched-chain amino acid transport system substrate-binding protein